MQRKLTALADGLGMPMAQLAIAWCLARPEITSVIIGATRPEQIAQNVRASGVSLDEAAMEQISMILGG